MSEFTQNKSTTDAKVIKHQHQWQIKNYKFCKYGKDALTSPPFTIPGSGEEQWHIELIHCSRLNEMNRYDDSLCLILNAEPKRLVLDLTLSVITSEKLIVDVCTSLKILDKKNGRIRSSRRDKFTDIIKKLPSDTFTIHCEIGFMTEIENIELMKDTVKFEMPKRNFFDDLEQVYNDDTTADVTLTVQNTTIRAHKTILMARSPVFNAMFRNNMRKSITNNVDIENLDAEILKETLRFIYTDKVTNFEDKAFQLLDAAEKYDLPKLKAMCEESLSKNISVESVAEILVIADRHGAHQLKTQVFHFIKSHMEKVVNTAGYRNLENHHPKLTLQTFKAIALL